MEQNIFELAARNKFRYHFKGEITTEDLFDLSETDLDAIYKSLKSEQKKAEEDSLMTTRNKEDTILAAKIEIVKTIFELKQNEKAARKAKAEQQIQRKKILQALAEQKENALKSKSPEELLAMLKDLDPDEE